MAILDLHRLHVLREVGRSGSLTSAAAALSFTTSAVSQQIAKLEQEMGVVLIERHPRGVVLTEAGHALLHYADDIDRTVEAARAEERTERDAVTHPGVELIADVAADLHADIGSRDVVEPGAVQGANLHKLDGFCLYW